MKSALRLLLLAGMVTPGFAGATQQEEYTCSYQIYGAPFAEVTLTVIDGVPQDRAKIVFQGRQNEESVTPVDVAPGEKFHVWLSKENPDNSLELFIFSAPQVKGDSKLVNHHMPVLNEMWGPCQVR